VHRVVVEGSPSVTLDLHLRGDGHTSPGLQATAMRLVNAIPAVVAAPPGIVTPLDLELGRHRSLLRRDRGPAGR
jgi:4-hydroxy-tetrahydrodipicolinate reductase